MGLGSFITLLQTYLLKLNLGVEPLPKIKSFYYYPPTTCDGHSVFRPPAIMASPYILLFDAATCAKTLQVLPVFCLLLLLLALPFPIDLDMIADLKTLPAKKLLLRCIPTTA